MKYLYGPGPGRKDYVSEFTQFMNGYLHEHPEVERDRMLGWRIWWERFVRPEQLDQQVHADLDKPTYHSYYYE
jgi:hypothetical protein